MSVTFLIYFSTIKIDDNIATRNILNIVLGLNNSAALKQTILISTCVFHLFDWFQSNTFCCTRSRFKAIQKFPKYFFFTIINEKLSRLALKLGEAFILLQKFSGKKGSSSVVFENWNAKIVFWECETFWEFWRRLFYTSHKRSTHLHLNLKWYLSVWKP